MREVDTDALLGVAEGLGVGNPITSVANVTFDDDNLQQHLEVSRFIRRARRGIVTQGGIANWTIRNVHAGASGVTSFITPYTQGQVTGQQAPWPQADVRAKSDLWILAIDAQRSSGVGDVVTAEFRVQQIDGANGFNQNTWPLAAFGPVVDLVGTDHLSELTTGSPIIPFTPVRIPRDTELAFQSESDGACTLLCTFTALWVPRAMGQDAVGAP